MDLEFEKDFLKTIIIDFKKCIAFLDDGLFGKLFFQEQYKAEAKQEQKTTLNVLGTMAFLYILKYKERYPILATVEQQQRINEIWLAMEMPENVVPV
jgi:hypothetical protein